MRWLFLRALGAIYAIAFLSLSVQIAGLIGESGILPASQLLGVLRETAGDTAFLLCPSIFWLNTSDQALISGCIFGFLAALAAAFGVMARPAFALCWLLYLSLTSVGQDFLAFQWDILLLETGFLAIFLAPWRRFDPAPFGRTGALEEPPVLMIWVLRLLIFKLMLLSGVVKIASGDMSWHSLTALQYHWFTQPLPTPLAYFMDKLALPLQQGMAFGMFVIELLAPFLIFFKRTRWLAAIAFAALQILIMFTGNYTFFNWLTIALCVPLFDDAQLYRLIRSLPIRKPFETTGGIEPNKAARFAAIGLAVFLGLLSFPVPKTQDGEYTSPLAPIQSLMRPLRITNSYGLFAVMTTTRPEIIVEGTADGEHWLPYEFKYKPGDLFRAPPMVAPHQPRVDWQMWFAGLGSLDESPWFLSFSKHLLNNTPAVVSLLEKNPFPDEPPKLIRARTFQYKFSKMDSLFREGRWWQRTEDDPFMPPVGLRRNSEEGD